MGCGASVQVAPAQSAPCTLLGSLPLQGPADSSARNAVAVLLSAVGTTYLSVRYLKKDARTLVRILRDAEHLLCSEEDVDKLDIALRAVSRALDDALTLLIALADDTLARSLLVRSLSGAGTKADALAMQFPRLQAALREALSGVGSGHAMPMRERDFLQSRALAERVSEESGAGPWWEDASTVDAVMEGMRGEGSYGVGARVYGRHAFPERLGSETQPHAQHCRQSLSQRLGSRVHGAGGEWSWQEQEILSARATEAGAMLSELWRARVRSKADAAVGEPGAGKEAEHTPAGPRVSPAPPLTGPAFLERWPHPTPAQELRRLRLLQARSLHRRFLATDAAVSACLTAQARLGCDHLACGLTFHRQHLTALATWSLPGEPRAAACMLAVPRWAAVAALAAVAAPTGRALQATLPDGTEVGDLRDLGPEGDPGSQGSSSPSDRDLLDAFRKVDVHTDVFLRRAAWMADPAAPLADWPDTPLCHASQDRHSLPAADVRYARSAPFVRVNDARLLKPAMEHLRPGAELTRLGTCAACAVVMDGERVGAVTVGKRQRDAWGDREWAVLEGLAEDLARLWGDAGDEDPVGPPAAVLEWGRRGDDAGG